MKSIRLSLMLYVLALLALVLGAVSLLAYQMAHQTLMAKKAATQELLKAQYEERCREERQKTNDDLVYRATALAKLLQIKYPGRQRVMPARALGLLLACPASSCPTPGSFLLMPVYLTEAARGPIYGEMYRTLGVGEIKIEIEHPEQVAEFFQINSSWGSSYRSPSLGEHHFPPEAEVLTQNQVLNWTFDDVELWPGQMVHYVVLKTPSPHLVPIFRGDRHSRSRGNGAPFGNPPPLPPERPPEETPPRPTIVIQVACSLGPQQAALASHLAEQNDALAQLDTETDESLASLRYRLLAISLLAFAASAAGSFCLVRMGLAPLERLSVAVSRVSAKDFRLQFNQRRLPRELTVIVDRLTQTLDMLKRAFAREKQAAADISHELRTPLAALLTTTEVALRKPRTPEEYRELLADCHESGQQMSRMVERLLTLARLDAGVDTLRPQSVDAAMLAEQCANLVRPLAEAQAVSLRVHHEGPAPLKTDPDKFREVLTNLLHNAIQYNRPEGSIDVTVARNNGHLEMEVRDTGIGIAPEARSHIFERFYRADPARQADGLHAGLGLAIVKGYVDLMGGSIDVESKEGQGSTFRILLPAT